MGGVSQHIVTEEESPKKYKEARRRRIEMRRFGTSLDSQGNRNRKESKIDNIDISTDRKRKRSAEMNEPLSSSSSSGGGEVEPISTTMMPSTSRQNPATVHVLPVYGAVAVSGRSREMEDAVSVRPDFCRPVISCRKPVHFFAVYDGHGGSQVATLCKESMHVFLEGELMRETDASVGTASTSPAEVEIQESWKFALEKSFERMDEIALSTCACGGMGSSCGCDSGGLSCEIVGSTAVVALLTLDKIIVANCGDSRAVLSRGGRAIPLSFDHKPDRPDELARIEAAGGRVIYLNGARVQGILAMSRALDASGNCFVSVNFFPFLANQIYHRPAPKVTDLNPAILPSQMGIGRKDALKILPPPNTVSTEPQLGNLDDVVNQKSVSVDV
ncbi:hypothetical protein IFM89_020988 [Coptis chinensis]|uniref:protein-serine/threonine phosphatase n=1 Tax=Coptis chinensis TaxID=261450 RepID=A0A835M8T3_9MAGN|nr:hypothetical protein IFM89_020988 [Coptis chinensis]